MHWAPREEGNRESSSCRRSALVALSQEEKETGYVIVLSIPTVRYWVCTVNCMLLGVRVPSRCHMCFNLIILLDSMSECSDMQIAI